MSIDISLDDQSMIERLINKTASDIALNQEQARRVIQTMRYGIDAENEDRKKEGYHIPDLSKWADIPIIDRASIAFQSYINLAHSHHVHAPIADSLVAIAFGETSFHVLQKKVTPEFCDPHSEKPEEIEKCVKTWGIPTPAQFLFGRSYEGVTAITGGATNDIRRLIAQERMLVIPKGLNVAIVTDNEEAYTLTTASTPKILVEHSVSEPFAFYSPGALQSLQQADGLTAVIWDIQEYIPDLDSLPCPTKVLISEDSMAVHRANPDYLIVTELDDISEETLFSKFPVLRSNQVNTAAQSFEGDAIFHITHISGSPQRTIGYPWFPETTKALHQPVAQKQGLLKRIFSKKA